MPRMSTKTTALLQQQPQSDRQTEPQRGSVLLTAATGQFCPIPVDGSTCTGRYFGWSRWCCRNGSRGSIADTSNSDAEEAASAGAHLYRMSETSGNRTRRACEASPDAWMLFIGRWMHQRKLCDPSVRDVSERGLGYPIRRSLDGRHSVSSMVLRRRSWYSTHRELFALTERQ